LDQGRTAEGLGQETSCSVLQRSRADSLFGERRDENERHAASLGAQEGLQLDTAHGRHLDIRNHARRVIQVGRAQELGGRRECINGVSKRPYETTRRGANGRIIVNDRDHGKFEQDDRSFRELILTPPYRRMRREAGSGKSYL